MRKEPQKKPLLVSFYEDYLKQRMPNVFAAGVRQYYSPATLERMATTGDCLCRRAAILALGLLGDYESNPIMGSALLDADRGVRRMAEKSIRLVWRRMGSARQRSELETIIQFNQQEHHQQAIAAACELIEQAPWFAEVWNQRAIASSHLKFYTDSIRACCRTLEINPYQFESAVRMGRCHLELKDLHSALECFQRALQLNSDLAGIRAKVIYLQKSLHNE